MAWEKVIRTTVRAGAPTKPCISLRPDGSIGLIGGLLGVMGHPTRVNLLIDKERNLLGLQSDADGEFMVSSDYQRADGKPAYSGAVYAKNSLKDAGIPLPTSPRRAIPLQWEPGIWAVSLAHLTK